jgi:hydroxypyruvate reductase
MPDKKSIAREIFRQTVASIDIPGTMERKLFLEGKLLILPDASVDLSKISEVRVVAIGKAAHSMVAGLPCILPDGLPVCGVVSAPTKPEVARPGLQYFVGGHPVPNAEGWRAAEAILALLQPCTAETLTLFLVSGGGSALLELPLDATLSLEDVQTIYRALVTCGAPIDAMNTVRKHLSAVKGGRLAVAAGPAQKITLAVTDVPVGSESALASGPTLPDPTTIADVTQILEQYGLRKRFPPASLRWLDAGNLPETPKAGHPAFRNAHFLLLLGMDDLFHAAHHAVEAHGYLSCCDNSTDDWPLDKAVDSLLAQLADWQRENGGQRVAIIADGEVSSPVTGDGIGGRNSAFVLACVQRIAGGNITVFSVGTDGIDGNSPAAGAIADGRTLDRARAAGMDPADFIRRSDAYTFFNRLDDAIITGPTGNNLRDLRIFLAEPLA